MAKLLFGMSIDQKYYNTQTNSKCVIISGELKNHTRRLLIGQKITFDFPDNFLIEEKNRP